MNKDKPREGDDPMVGERNQEPEGTNQPVIRDEEGPPPEERVIKPGRPKADSEIHAALRESYANAPDSWKSTVTPRKKKEATRAAIFVAARSLGLRTKTRAASIEGDKDNIKMYFAAKADWED